MRKKRKRGKNMYERAKKFLELLKTALVAIGFLCGIAVYGMYGISSAKVIWLAMPFIGAFLGAGLAYLTYGVSCACIYISNAIHKRGGPLPYIQKKIVISLIFLAMLGYFIAVCVMEKEAIGTYLSVLDLPISVLAIVFMPCVYPFLVLKGEAPYVQNMELVQPLYITLWVFTIFVVCLYIYSEWIEGGVETAYYEVTYDRESGHEVKRRAISYGEVYTWQNILSLLFLIFSLLAWPPVTIAVLLVRMIGWDYLCY
jgi:hypothetical protein